MRWRLRGAWMWPTFAAVTLLDGVLLHLLPPVREGIGLIPGILIATFGNLVLIGAIAAGLAARPTIVVETEQRERAAKLLEDYVDAHGDDELRRNLEASDTHRYADGYYRSCIPHDDRKRWTCFFIDVRKKRSRFDRDPSQLPNKPNP